MLGASALVATTRRRFGKAEFAFEASFVPD
jgi:hypothetical protein